MKEKEAKRLALEKAQIEALIEKYRPHTPKTLDEVNTSCYHNLEHFKCNGVINYKQGLKYYKSSPLLVPQLQHMGKHAPLSLLTP